MNLERQNSTRVRAGKHRAKTKEDKIEKIKANLEEISRKDISDKLLPHLLDKLGRTKEGRNGIARAISRKDRVYIPSAKSSLSSTKSWRNKVSKSAVDLRQGLSSCVNPDNPKEYEAILFGTSTLPVSSYTTPAGAVVPMNPRNPATAGAEAVLPQRVGHSSNANSHASEDENLPRYIQPHFPLGANIQVTMASLASIMPGDANDTPSLSPTPLPPPPNSSDPCSESSSDGSEATIKRKRRKNQLQLGRKSMLYKTKKKREEAMANVRQSLGDAIIDKIKELKTVRERRPLLALVALKHNRKDVNNALGIYTNRFEWRKCKVHAHHPGPLDPVRKPLIQRLKISKELLYKLLEFLKNPGNLQRSAFGTQIRVLLDGRETCEMDNVSRLKKLDKLLCDFVTYILSEVEVLTAKDGSKIPEDEHRCTNLDQKAKFLRCMKGRKHEGKCEYTATDSICPNTVRTLVASLTAGDIKSLSGLDDIKVLKG
jgi:hypothetical protein